MEKRRTPERDILIAEGCFCHLTGISLGNDNEKQVAKINCVEGMLCPYKWIQTFLLPDIITKNKEDQAAKSNEPWLEISAAGII